MVSASIVTSLPSRSSFVAFHRGEEPRFPASRLRCRVGPRVGVVPRSFASDVPPGSRGVRSRCASRGIRGARVGLMDASLSRGALGIVTRFFARPREQHVLTFRRPFLSATHLRLFSARSPLSRKPLLSVASATRRGPPRRPLPRPRPRLPPRRSPRRFSSVPRSTSRSTVIR